MPFLIQVILTAIDENSGEDQVIYATAAETLIQV